MKTFTTYAEKKAKQILNLLQGYTKGIRITAVLTLLLTMGVGQVWAYVNASAYVYFDPNDKWNYTNYYFASIQETGNWQTKTYKLSNITNTKLYYLSTTAHNDAGFISFGGQNGTFNGGYWGYDSFKSYITMCGEKCNWGLNDQNTYLFYPSANTKGTSLNPQYLGGGFNDLNSEQTIKTVVDGTVANSKATISITSYKMTGNGTATEQTATLGTGAKDSYITAARTATTTLTVGTVATGYQFDGWYTAATGGTQLSTDETYTYYPTAATTVYARFSTKQHTVLFGVHSSGHGSLTAKIGSTSITSGNKVDYGSEVVFTAKPDDGYQIEGWYSNSACTTPIDNGTNDTYTVTITGGTNVYVKFEAIPANSHNITYTAQATGWTYGNSNPTTAEEGATVTFVVNPTAGYSVNVTSSDATITGPNASNEYSFTMPAKDVAINVSATEKLTTVTLNVSSGSGSFTVDNTSYTSGSTVTVGVATSYIVKAIANTGYTFNKWTRSGNASASGSGNTVTLTGNGDGGIGTLNAYFNRTYAFIQGRFRVNSASRNQMTYTYNDGGQWKEDGTNIQMEYDDTNSRFYLHTYMKPKELTENHGTGCQDCKPYFYIKTSTSSSSLVNTISYQSTTSQTLTTAGISGKKGLATSGGSNANLRFDTQDESGYVVLYFDEQYIWYELEYRLDYNANGGTGTAPSRTYHFSGTNITAKPANTFTREGYTFTGWNTAEDGSGTSYAAGASVTINKNTTLYAQWEENTFAVTINANGNGTVNPNGEQEVGTEGLEVEAKPADGYQLTEWTTTGGAHVANSTNTTTTITATAVGTVTANFSAIIYTITYNLDGGTNHADNPTNYTIETPTITLQDPTRNGYTFGGWYNNSSFSGSPITTISQGSTDNITLYAKWTEITSTVTVTTANEAYGTLKFGSTTKDWGTTASVGVTTTQNITATANNGYKFVRWELTGGAQSSSTLTDATITLKGDGNGTEGTATAVFEEDLSTSYVLKGGSAFGGTAWSTEYKLEKKSGQSTIDIAYVTFTLNSTNIGNSNDDFNFKIVKKGTDDTWYGLTADGSYWYNRSTGEQTLSTSGADIQLRADVTGTYEIKVDYTDVNNNNNNPKITVIFPSSSMSLVGTFNDWNESANPFVIDGDIATATIDLPMGDHEFKINDGGTWRTMTADSRVVTRDANQDINFNTTGGSGNNTILNADATGTYTFKYNKSSQTLTVEYPDITIRLTGEFNGWNNSDDNYKFTEDPAKPGTYTLTKHFDKRERWQAYGKEQAEYEFKLNINGKSYTVEGDGEAKVLQYTRQNTTKIVNDGTDYTEQPYYNLLLQADQSGDYLFTYDSYTRQLTVTHPKYYPEASYIVGDFSDGKEGTDAMPGNGINSDEGHDWTEKYGQELEDGVGCIELGKNSTWNFKIKINGIGYGADIDDITTSGTYTLDDEYADTGEKNVTIKTTNEDGCYYFEYTLNDGGTLSVLIIFPNDRRTVTFNMQGHGTQVDEQHVLYNQTAVKPYVSDVAGYLFGGWYTDANCTAGTEYDFTKPVTQDITLYAKWIPYEDCIFFKNNLNWDSVYVYFYSSDYYWDNNKGTGSKKEKEINGSKAHYREFRGQMIQIGKTDIWYFDYISAAKIIDPTYYGEIESSKNIAFTANKQYDYEFFDNTKVIRRGDFNRDMQLFIPQTDQTPDYLNQHDGKSAKYYNKGLWMKYNDIYSGYDWSGKTADTDWGDTQLKADIAGEYSFVAEVYLNVGKNYEFKIKNLNDDWYGNNGTMTAENCTNWHFETNLGNAKITPTVTGNYIFTVYLGDGKVMVSLEYPLVPGDYRLAYKDNTAGSFHPGHYIKKRNKDQNDTVSFFIHHDKEPQVIVQVCTEIDVNGNETWATINEISENPAAGITETGVYNFTLQQIADESTPRLLSQHSPYTGDYYIRTYAANGGWRTFRHKDNLMTYSSYADVNDDFDHYFCKWVDQEKGMKNVSYTVANNYSYCISDTLLEDIDPGHPLIVTNAEGDLPEGKSANVRFGWDSKTNKLRRAYIAGSGHKKDRFLVLQGNEHLADINGNRYTGQTAPGQDRYNLTDNEVVLDDMGNWIYQMDVQANKDTEIKLTALYNDLVQYFKGTETKSVGLLASTATTNYKIRLIYDFKTNHLVIAWLAGGEIINNEDKELGADMMIIRHNQDPAEQLNFDPNTRQLSQVGTAYAVMTFDKYFLNNKNPNTGNALATADEKSSNERMFYWISFPFDVKISDVFGFGEYGDYWIMEYYDGAERAAKGWWAETETFWKYITNKNYVLKAGQGYVLCLNLNKMGFVSTVFANTAEVSLYFPSTGPLNTITGELPAAVDVPAHTCTIERDNRNIYDSHWNLIGVPGFANIEDVGIGEHLYKPNPLVQDSVSFYYEYIPATNKYHTQTQTETFQTMYSYMIQYTGTINWRTPAFSDPALMARRIGELPDQYTLRLVLHSGDKEEDQTFVQLQEERATADFDMNLDLAKMMNSGANIYTLTANTAIMVAGNALPMEKATVPVGVRVDAAGEYTFRMPDGTDGIAVTLVDNVTGTHTNMLMNEYTVTLNAGTIENRFYLVVDPDRTATSVENVGSGANGDEAKGVEKFLIDGKLFIRTTNGIFDAKGQRL